MGLEPERPRGHALLVVSILLGLTTLGSLLIVGLMLGGRATAAQTRSEERRAIVAEALIYSCTEIELLRAGFREEALRSFRDLDKTLKLLKLKRTPALVDAATESRDRKLERYAPRPCPLSRGELNE